MTVIEIKTQVIVAILNSGIDYRNVPRRTFGQENFQ